MACVMISFSVNQLHDNPGPRSGPQMLVLLRPSVFPLRLYLVKLAQHFGKLAQQILWKSVKKIIFLDNLACQFLAYANDFGARTPEILWNLVELAQAEKP